MLIKSYDHLVSTQTEAKYLIDRGEVHNKLIIVAKEQSAGRGKNIRKWHSDKGDLLFTIILKPNIDQDSYAQLTYIAAISISNVISMLCPNYIINHKWVNDVLLNHRKISGILLENYKENFVLIGIGVNIVSKNLLSEISGIGLEDVGIKITSNKLLSMILKEFFIFYEHWLNFGFEKIRNAWLAKAINLQNNIIVSVNDSNISGVFHGIDNHGYLELNQDGQLLKIRAGDVFL